MQGTVVVDGVSTSATSAAVADLVSSGASFWLDLDGVDDEASTLLAATFGFHPLAVEDAEHFGQRPKIDEFDDFTYFVVHGALPEGRRDLEMHIFFQAPVRRDRAPRGVPRPRRHLHAVSSGVTVSATPRPR